MQIENSTTPEPEIDNDYYDNLKKVTPVSKYLAMTLFVALPFIGGWIGYNYAPEKVVEVDKVVVREMSVSTNQIPDESLTDSQVSQKNPLSWSLYTDNINKYSLRYLAGHTINIVMIDHSTLGQGTCIGSPQEVGGGGGIIFQVAIDDPDDTCVSSDYYSGLLDHVLLTDSEYIEVNGNSVLKRTYVDDLPEPEVIIDLVGEQDYSPERYRSYTYTTYRFQKDGAYFTLSIDFSPVKENQVTNTRTLQEFISSFRFLE